MEKLTGMYFSLIHYISKQIGYLLCKPGAFWCAYVFVGYKKLRILKLYNEEWSFGHTWCLLNQQQAKEKKKKTENKRFNKEYLTYSYKPYYFYWFSS